METLSTNEGVLLETIDGLEFICIDSPDSSFLDSYQELVKGSFTDEELDSLDITQAALRENHDNPNRRGDLMLIVVKNEQNEAVAAINASYTSAKDKSGVDLGWGFINVNYITAKVKNLTKKLYQYLDDKAREIAKSKGEIFKYTVGETKPDVEGLVNKHNRYRLYYLKDGQYIEIAYLQAPLEWEEDGSPKSEPVPLHRTHAWHNLQKVL